MLQQEELEQIVDALMTTPQMQWVTQNMNTTPPGPGGTPPAPPASPASPVPGGDTDLANLDDLLEGGDDDGAPPPAEPPEKKGMSQYTQDTDDALVDRYTALEAENQELKAQLEKYTASHDGLIEEHGRTVERLQSLERSAADANRKMRLSALASEREGVSLEDECKLCLYSMESEMSDSEFEAHVTAIEKYAKPRLDDVEIPGGDAARAERADREKYAAQVKDKALEIHRYAMDAGESLTWDQCRAKAVEALEGKATE